MAQFSRSTGPNSKNSVLAVTLRFFKMETAGGIMLVAAAILAMIVANTPLFSFYNHILNDVYFQIGFNDPQGHSFQIKKNILHWINDGFMAIFFFLVGLEIKREIKEGELSSKERLLLPTLAALGGMVVPALAFWFINMDSPENLHGWAIPAATDIAFALAVLGILGRRVPVALKVLLTAIAIMDDLGAIVIIALFYSQNIDMHLLYASAGAVALLAFLNYRNVARPDIYVVVGVVMWVTVLHSGVHATLAGVITALFVPMRCESNPEYSPCKYLEHSLHPWVAFLILPLFGFANAGVSLAGMGLQDLMEPVTLGIICGLFFGKQIGVFFMLWLAVALKLSPLPKGVTWRHLYGVSILCGIGFTMSLFIGELAYQGGDQQVAVRMGVLVGSLLSAVCAYVFLRTGSQNEPARQMEMKQKLRGLEHVE